MKSSHEAVLRSWAMLSKRCCFHSAINSAQRWILSPDLCGLWVFIPISNGRIWTGASTRRIFSAASTMPFPEVMYRHKLVYLTIYVHLQCSHIHVVAKSIVHYHVSQGVMRICTGSRSNIPWYSCYSQHDPEPGDPKLYVPGSGAGSRGLSRPSKTQ